MKRPLIIFLCLWCAGISLAAIIGPGRVQRRVVAVGGVPYTPLALYSSGATARVSYPSTPMYACTAITISAWVKVLSPKRTAGVWGVNHINDHKYELETYISTNFGYLVFYGASGLAYTDASVISPTYPTLATSYCHVVWQWDSSKSVRMYFNGVTQALAYGRAGTEPTSLLATGRCAIGFLNATVSGTFTNMLAVTELNVWTNILTSTDVTYLYNSGAGRWGTNTSYPWLTNLVTIHHLQDGAGTTAVDTGPRGLNATLTGTTNYWDSGFISP